MKISIVCSSLANNGIVRPWILARLLSRHYEVEAIGGLRAGERVWPGCADYPWRPVPIAGMAAGMRRLERAISGDLVVAYGVRLLSFGTALLARWRRRLPVVLDMPEWQVFEHYDRRRLAQALMVAGHLVGPGWSRSNSFKYRWVLDQLVWAADERTVCCTFLQRRYGGVHLPQGVDTTLFDPARFDKAALRRKWGLPADATLLVFGGNPQPRKGLEEIVEVLARVGDRIDLRLVVVGRDEDHPFTSRLAARAPGRIIVLGVQPIQLMPELLATADLVALPQRRSPKSLGYVPCKLYEAMAMELPVVASGVSDVPDILEGCGYVVPPDDPDRLRAAVEHVVSHPDEARERGRRARVRVHERYSWDVMDGILRDVVERVRRPQAA